MATSQPNLTQIDFSSAKWIMQGGQPTLSLSITPVAASQSPAACVTTVMPMAAAATVTPILNVASILPTKPLPPAYIQTVISSSTGVTPVTLASQNLAVTQNNVVTSSNTSGKKSGPGETCSGDIVTHSTRELRLKGSSFLRTHASKHGIPNASRKLTAQVMTELCQHYLNAHNVRLIHDDNKEPNVSMPPPIKIKKSNEINPVATAALPQQPLPITQLKPQEPAKPPQQLQQQLPQQQLPQQLQQQLPQQQQQQQVPQHQGLAQICSIVEQELRAHQESPTPPKFRRLDCQAESKCRAEVLVKTREELSACGTSILRPEAAAHKVHNASRKPKGIVVEELWRHYVQCHKEFTESLWVGSVVDEDEEVKK